MSELNTRDIIGMRIQTEIAFDKKPYAEEKNNLICQIENDIENVISKYNGLICFGGKGEWIYSDDLKIKRVE